jgi:hypothetical protein
VLLGIVVLLVPLSCRIGQRERPFCSRLGINILLFFNLVCVTLSLSILEVFDCIETPARRVLEVYPDIECFLPILQVTTSLCALLVLYSPNSSTQILAGVVGVFAARHVGVPRQVAEKLWYFKQFKLVIAAMKSRPVGGDSDSDSDSSYLSIDMNPSLRSARFDFSSFR